MKLLTLDGIHLSMWKYFRDELENCWSKEGKATKELQTWPLIIRTSKTWELQESFIYKLDKLVE